MASSPSPRPLPKYRRQKRKGKIPLAFVELGDRRHYLGPYGSAESRERYDRVIAEWVTNGRRPSVDQTGIMVVELVERFWGHVTDYYRKPDGRQTSEVQNMRLALRPVKRMYGQTKAVDFGPRSFKAVRQALIGQGGSRTYVNRHMNRIRLMFKWAAAEELVPPTTHQALQAVAGLKRGRTEARETEPIRPVPQDHIDAIQSYVGRQVWSMVQLQLFTSARPGELVIMRPIDLQMTGEVWIYEPEDHKTAHHGHQRSIFIGPRAQRVIEPFLSDRPLNARIFSPAEAEAERRQSIHAARKTPWSCGNVPGSNRRRNPKRKPGDEYTVDSYRWAIHRACDAAGIPKWSPHRLRHSAATHVRTKFGLEAAQVMLGHARCDVTQVYAEINRAKALEVAAEIG